MCQSCSGNTVVSVGPMPRGPESIPSHAAASEGLLSSQPCPPSASSWRPSEVGKMRKQILSWAIRQRLSECRIRRPEGIQLRLRVPREKEAKDATLRGGTVVASRYGGSSRLGGPICDWRTYDNRRSVLRARKGKAQDLVCVSESLALLAFENVLL